jgi:hypothetical protein
LLQLVSRFTLLNFPISLFGLPEQVFLLKNTPGKQPGNPWNRIQPPQQQDGPTRHPIKV